MHCSAAHSQGVSAVLSVCLFVCLSVCVPGRFCFLVSKNACHKNALVIECVCVPFWRLVSKFETERALVLNGAGYFEQAPKQRRIPWPENYLLIAREKERERERKRERERVVKLLGHESGHGENEERHG